MERISLQQITVTENSEEEITSLKLDGKNIFNITIKLKCFENVEYLSLQNNFIKYLNFIKMFPKLWSLDIRNNQVNNDN